MFNLFVELNDNEKNMGRINKDFEESFVLSFFYDMVVLLWDDYGVIKF